MIAGGYVLHLYCDKMVDGRKCHEFFECPDNPQTLGKAKAIARKHGWTIKFNHGERATVYCPEHRPPKT
jgi:hypothetical protein